MIVELSMDRKYTILRYNPHPVILTRSKKNPCPVRVVGDFCTRELRSILHVSNTTVAAPNVFGKNSYKLSYKLL